MKPFFLRPR
jgi:hypothetical protein